MPTRYDLNAEHAAARRPDPDLRINDAAPPPAGWAAKAGCGLLAGLIVIGVSSLTSERYDAAEAAGAAQVRIAEAEAEQAQSPQAMRGVNGMASADHNWVFDR